VNGLVILALIAFGVGVLIIGTALFLQRRKLLRERAKAHHERAKWDRTDAAVAASGGAVRHSRPGETDAERIALARASALGHITKAEEEEMLDMPPPPNLGSAEHPYKGPDYAKAPDQPGKPTLGIVDGGKRE
jgi:hypothetical protein